MADRDLSERDILIEKLHLDFRNPRLPEELTQADESQLIEFVAEEYDALRIAKSIALFGYFYSEPLIGIHEQDEMVIVEGNRRLATLKLLNDEDLRQKLELSRIEEWEAAARSDKIPDAVPVVVQDSRAQVAPVLGYRHISGIEPWDPWSKARFIASMVEEGERDFEEAATLVGENETDVRSHYRNYRIVRQLRDSFHINTERPEERFGVFTRAMQSVSMRNYVGAPAPAAVQREVDPLPDSSRQSSEELLSWLFGDDEDGPVIKESRQIQDLSTVLDSSEGVQVLRDTRNLEEAFISAGGVRDRLLDHLTKARNELRRAREDYPTYADDKQVEDLLGECQETLDSFRFES